MPWVGLQCVIVAFLGIIYLPFENQRKKRVLDKFLLLPYLLSSISIYAGAMNALQVAQTVSNTYFGC